MTSPLIETPENFRAHAMSLLNYDPQTGIFTWRETRNHKAPAGSEAGSLNDKGYVLIKVMKKAYAGHRLAWLFVHGRWPPQCIDHINRNRADNRIANLRVASHGENQRNAVVRQDNISGVRGVWWVHSLRKWRATLKINGVAKNLGQFDKKSDAIAARRAAEDEHFKAFAPPTDIGGAPTLADALAQVFGRLQNLGDYECLELAYAALRTIEASGHAVVPTETPPLSARPKVGTP